MADAPTFSFPFRAPPPAPTLAWSTVTILVLLLPGFVVGFYLPDNFSRAAAP